MGVQILIVTYAYFGNFYRATLC